MEREILRECVEIALQAPTGSNMQNVHFVIVDDPARKAALADLYAKGWQIYETTPVYAGHVTFDDPAQREAHTRALGSAEYLVAHMREVPALVIPCIAIGTERHHAWADMGYSPDTAQPVIAHAGVWGSVIPAAWSFLLAARARGLGGTWTVVHLFFEKEAAEILGVPHGKVVQAALIPIGHTIGGSFHRGPRPPVDEVLHWNGW